MSFFCIFKTLSCKGIKYFCCISPLRYRNNSIKPWGAYSKFDLQGGVHWRGEGYWRGAGLIQKSSALLEDKLILPEKYLVSSRYHPQVLNNQSDRSSIVKRDGQKSVAFPLVVTTS